MEPLDFDYVKARFDAEHARAKSLSDSLTLPIGLLTAVGGLLGAMGRSFTYRPGPTRIAFLVFGAGDAVAFLVALGYLVYAWHRQDLAYMQTVGELVRAKQRFREEAADDDTGATGAAIDAEFKAYVQASMVQATDLNIMSNDRRAAALYWARIWLVLLVLLTGIVGIPYVVDQATAPRPPLAPGSISVVRP